MPRAPLPIDPCLDDIVSTVRAHGAAVVTAEPGAGKSTRVPPALLTDGPVILLQPRRMAARAVARRIADDHRWTIGGQVGWHVRFERRYGPRTRLLVVTEGILTARLQQDPLLSEFRTVVLDEFHERSLQGDVGLALARQARRARPDLRIVVMSATLDAAPVAGFLDGCPVIEVAGRPHAVAVTYLPDESPVDAAVRALGNTSGQVLCFLAGAPEIRRAERELQAQVPGAGVDIVPLHGSLDGADQDKAIRETAGRRVILATNIAETSLTVPGVTAVVDTGLHKVARYDPDRGIDSLETERITQDSADQRAGRAGRLGPGKVWRLWDRRDRLRPHREPEILRVDLAAAVLDLVAWGADPRRFEWFEAPPAVSIDAAIDLLSRLGAIETGRLTATSPGLTAIGRQLGRLPLHPRLGRILVAALGAREAAAACAWLSERHCFPPRSGSTPCDLLSVMDEWQAVPPHIRHVTAEIERLAGLVLGDAKQAHAGDVRFRHALLSGYPDRVARRRSEGSPRVVLASGHGGIVTEDSGVRSGEYLLAIDARAGRKGEVSEARIRIASRIEREWLSPTRTSIEHRFEEATGRVHAIRIEWYDQLRLAEHPTGVDAAVAAELLAARYLERGPDERVRRIGNRARVAGLAIDVDDLVRRACANVTCLHDVDPESQLPHAARNQLDRWAPDTIRLPSGRAARVEYGDDGSVLMSVKLQELFGLADTPRVGTARTPVTVALLAPNGRPVQVTRDLRSFWDRTYPQVRGELRARYPKHPWPEDPWTAHASAGTRPSRRRRS